MQWGGGNVQWEDRAVGSVQCKCGAQHCMGSWSNGEAEWELQERGPKWEVDFKCNIFLTLNIRNNMCTSCNLFTSR